MVEAIEVTVKGGISELAFNFDYVPHVIADENCSITTSISVDDAVGPLLGFDSSLAAILRLLTVSESMTPWY